MNGKISVICICLIIWDISDMRTLMDNGLKYFVTSTKIFCSKKRGAMSQSMIKSPSANVGGFSFAKIRYSRCCILSLQILSESSFEVFFYVIIVSKRLEEKNLERLQKIIARAGICSRREAEKLILDGKVTVDGKIITELGAKADIAKNKIRVNGKLLNFDTEKIYLLLNKPRGYVSTTHDERGRPTVLDLIDTSERIYPIGRLDLNSEGLILLTNDGELTNLLIHPRFEVKKTYRAKISGEITEEKLDKLRAGIELDDGLTAPAEIYRLDKDLIEITIHEGRNRQVRRMFSAIGCDVKRLKRIKFGNLTLEGVGAGKYRKLTSEEVAELKGESI